MVTKVSATLLTFILILSSLTVYPTPLGFSQTDYSEDISVTMIGNTAYWEVNMRGGNYSTPGLSEAERGAAGVSRYWLSAVDSSNWSSEYELFSNSGFNLLGFDALPASGVFLKVEANSFESARAFADSLNRVLRIDLTSYSALRSDVFIFYSHLDFNIVKNRWWSIVPVKYEGASRLINKEVFTTSQDVPIFKFSGENIGGGFTHTVTLAGLKRSAVTTDGKILVANILKDIDKTKSSPTAISSTITIRTIGSFITFADAGTKNVTIASVGPVRNTSENRSAAVTIAVRSGQLFPPAAIDLAQTFPSVIVTREVDRGALNRGDVVTVGIRVKNVAPPGSTPVGNITVNESWWRDSRVFEFLDGETSRTLGHLAPGANLTLAYRLQLISSDKGEAVAPPTSVTYSYKMGDAEIKESVKFNRLTFILNDVRPSITVEASPKQSIPPIFSVAPVDLTIRNIGNGHATSVEIDGLTRQSLLSGDVWRAQLNLTSRSLTDIVASRTWSVSWSEGGQRKGEESNSVLVHYNLTGVAIPQFDIGRSVVHTVVDEKNYVNETVTLVNKGSTKLDKVIFREEIPKGILFLNGSYIRLETVLSGEAAGIKAGEKKTFNYFAAVSNPDENYLFRSPEVIIEASGLTIIRLAKSEALPLGVNIFKNFETNANFVGANITVDVGVYNTGSTPIYDITFNVGADSFLKTVEGRSTSVGEQLAKSESLSLKNKVTFVKTGQFQTSDAITTFTVGGHTVFKSSKPSSIYIYNPLTAEITVTPSNPIEGDTFKVKIIVRNPSSVTVQDVRVNVDLPPEVRVTEGSLQLTAAELAANASLTREANLVVNVPQKISTAPPTIQFKYRDVVFKTASEPLNISVGDNVTLRYGAPLAIAAVITVVTTILARRTASSKKA